MPANQEVSKIYISRKDNKVHRVALPVDGVTRIGKIHREENDIPVEHTAQILKDQGIEVYIADLGEGEKRIITLEQISTKIHPPQKP